MFKCVSWWCSEPIERVLKGCLDGVQMAFRWQIFPLHFSCCVEEEEEEKAWRHSTPTRGGSAERITKTRCYDACDSWLRGALWMGGLWFFLTFQQAFEHCKIINWYSQMIASRSFFEFIPSFSLTQIESETGITPIEPHLSWKPLLSNLVEWS